MSILTRPPVAEAQRRGPYPYRFDNHTVAVRLDVEPEDAEVYVDGYLAGTVDDFDGIFQRLRLRPGEHEITLHLDGYRTIRERRYFNPDAALTIRLTMERLGAGEPQEPRPVPVDPPQVDPGRGPARPAEPERRRVEAAARFGTLSLQVRPADAEILIDDKPWPIADPAKPIALQLAAGRHKVEVRKEGYRPYVEDVLIRADRTLALNVGLTRR